MTEGPEYETGDRAVWVGTEGAMRRDVRVADVRVTGDLFGTVVYDIADPDTGRVVLYGATDGELRHPTD